jgi:HAE1 family hydrophobic/amphiphilic exporter-1
MSKVSPNDLPIMSISATSDLPATVFYQKMKDDYLPQIQQIKGVAEISVLGGEEREFQVNINQEKLKLYKVSMLQVVESINKSGIDLPAGKVESKKKITLYA